MIKQGAAPSVFEFTGTGFNKKELIEILPDGFLFAGKKYAWSDIKKIQRYDTAFWNFIFWQGGTPVAYIYMSDGKRIRIRGRTVSKKGKSSSVQFFSGKSSAYEELIGIFEKYSMHA